MEGLECLQLGPRLTSEQNAQTRTLQCQLIAKPALLNQVYQRTQSESVHTGNDASRLRSSVSVCTCRNSSRRRTPAKRGLFFEYTQRALHQGGCPFYIEGMLQRRTQIKLSYRLTLMSRSVQIVADLTTGAGGNSISTNVDWIPIVSSSSPAMQLMYQLEDGFYDGTNPAALLEDTRTRLMKLISQGQAHPRETNEHGYTLLWVTALT